jgi:glycosyltransferase involved in cell wall biosynthesis
MFELVRNRPDILVIGEYVNPTIWLAFMIAKLFGVVIIYWTEGMREPRTVLGIVSRPLRKLLAIESDAIVVPGRMSRRYVISLGANASKVFIAHNSIDLTLFGERSDRYRARRNALRDGLGLGSKTVLLCVSQLIERKGLIYLIRAYKRLEEIYEDVALLIIGSGASKQGLIKMANSIGVKNLRVIEPGLSLDELVKFYSISDYFVLPTLEDLWGFVINEAMACGLPVISTKGAQAAIEMIQPGENGYLVETADENALYLTISNLIQDKTLVKSMSEKSKYMSRTIFSTVLMKRQFTKAFRYAIHRRRHLRPKN